MSEKRTGCSRSAAVLLLACISTFWVPGFGTVAAQTATALPQIKKIYIGSLGGKKGSRELRDALSRRLRKVRGLEIVASPAEADAAITGSGELWIKGYYSTSPRPSPYAQNPIYGGVLSVEIKGQGGETLWSYLVTPHKFHWGTVTEDLADQLVQKFQDALLASAAKGASH